MTLVWQIVDSSNIGGIEKHMAVLTASLRQRGIDARIVLFEDHGNSPWITQLNSAGLSARHLDGTVLGLYRAMKKDRPALVHTHGYKAGIVARLAARALGIPTVSTFHMGESSKWPVSLYAAIDNATSFLSTRIAVSDAIQARLPFRSTVIPNYIQMASVLPNFTEPPCSIGFIGRLSHEKAPDYFCELARRNALRHRGNGDPINWHVYGDGPMRKDLEAEFGSCVTFHGMVTDMEAVWPNLGLCVMPSRGEGLPLASIEALSAGVPVLASNVGDLHKVVIENKSGWLVPAHDLNAFDAALSHWLQMPPAAKLALRRSAWQHADTNFSERNGLPQLFQIYAKHRVIPTPAA